MTLPSRKDIELPLLLEIEKAGGQAPWKNLSSPVPLASALSTNSRQ